MGIPAYAEASDGQGTNISTLGTCLPAGREQAP